MQKLMTEEIEQNAPALYETENEEDPMVVAHFFSCYSGWDWYVTEYDPKEHLAFGYVKGFANELGYFSIDELEATNERYGINVIERDEHFTPCRLSKVKES